MQAIRALHASAFVEHSDYVRQMVSQSVDLRGKSLGVDTQADSLRAYLSCHHKSLLTQALADALASK